MCTTVRSNSASSTRSRTRYSCGHAGIVFANDHGSRSRKRRRSSGNMLLKRLRFMSTAYEGAVTGRVIRSLFASRKSRNLTGGEFLLQATKFRGCSSLASTPPRPINGIARVTCVPEAVPPNVVCSLLRHGTWEIRRRREQTAYDQHCHWLSLASLA
jgi:hypothetical protein